MSGRPESARLRRLLPRLLPVFVLVAGVTLFHARGLQPGYTFLPVDLARTLLPWGDGAPRVVQNWLISDPLYQFYPFLTQAVDSIKRGDWLLWNPDILLGHPAAADPLFQTFYPGVLPFALWLGPSRGYAIALYAHAVLAALLMYGFLRSLRASPPAAVAGGFTYALSGYMLTWFEFSFWVATLAWLPGILWAFVLAVRRARWRYVALGGGCLGLALLAGQFQFVGVFLLFFGAGALAYAFLMRRWWPIAALLATVLLGGLIGAVQALPLADFLPLTTRSVAAAGRGLPISQFVALLLPNFYGNPSRSDYWGAGNFNESTIYVGIVALFLALLALAHARRLAFGAAIAAVAVLCLVYFLAGGPGTGLLEFVPLLNQVPLSRFAFLLPLLVGWLAAVALDTRDLARERVLFTALAVVVVGGSMAALFWNPGIAANLHLLREDVLVAVLLLVAAVAALLAARLPRYRAAAQWTVAGLVFVNLFWFGRTYNPVGKVDDLFAATETVQFLQARPANTRTVALQRGPILFGPNVLGMLGVAEPSGYSSLVTGRYHALLAAADPQLDSRLAGRSSNHLLFSYPTPRLLDMLAVDYMAASEELFDPGPEAEFVHDACTAATAPITDAAPLAGDFTVWRTAINRVDLQFVLPEVAASAGSSGGTLVFRMWRGATGDDLFVETRLPVADILLTPQQVVYFGAETDAQGRTYRWQLSAEGADAAGLRLCAGVHGTPELSVYGTQFAEVYNEDGVPVYARFTAFPRAAVVFAAETIADDTAAANRILDPAFDLRNIVVSSTPLDLPAIPPQPAQQAEIVAASNQRVTVHANTVAPGVLVLADQFYAGWEAHVDGVPAPIVRVNAILRGVPLAPGDHEIVFTFCPRALWIGGALSIFGLLLAVVIFLGSLRRSSN
jgi:hypothetical protein